LARAVEVKDDTVSDVDSEDLEGGENMVKETLEGNFFEVSLQEWKGCGLPIRVVKQDE